MAREAQHYVTDLLEELLGLAEKEKRFDWARGDSRTPGRPGVPLPFDAVWESRRLIIEIDEKQHDKPVAFFDKPGVMTVSGVHRGEQRRVYDERKVRLARHPWPARRRASDPATRRWGRGGTRGSGGRHGVARRRLSQRPSRAVPPDLLPWPATSAVPRPFEAVSHTPGTFSR
jgi:hypothetical protein